jgi:hypothetical protein
MKRAVLAAAIAIFAGAATAQENGPTAFDLAPEGQKEFVGVIEQFRQAYDNASNDMQAGAQRPLRAKALCSIVGDRRVKGWTGYIATLSSNSDGLGVLSIQIGEDIHASTWNNAFSDAGNDTLISADSEVFQQAAALAEGDPVKFSGRFLSSDTDCLQEQSISQSGSMTDPEFTFRFSAVEPLPGASKPKSKSLLKSLFD